MKNFITIEYKELNCFNYHNRHEELMNTSQQLLKENVTLQKVHCFDGSQKNKQTNNTEIGAGWQ